MSLIANTTEKSHMELEDEETMENEGKEDVVMKGDGLLFFFCFLSVF